MFPNAQTLSPVRIRIIPSTAATDPRLPPFLDEVTLRNLQLGSSSVDVRIQRHQDDVSLEILRTHGKKIQVSIVSSR